MEINFKIIFILLFIIPFITSIDSINIKITNQTDLSRLKTIGPEGTFGLITNLESLNFIYDQSDLEPLTIFEGAFMDKERGKKYNWICRLWDPKNMNVVVLCTVDNTIIEASDKYFTLVYGSIEVGEYSIIVSCNEEYYFEIDMKPFPIPFIYSEPQEIDLDSEKDSFQLRFKHDSFKGEKLAIVEKSKVESFTDCDRILSSNNGLLCTISRKKIEEVMTNNTSLSIVCLNGDLGLIFFQFIGDINVKYTQPKEDINLIITEVLNPTSERNSLIALKTNINEILPLTTNKFEIIVQSKSGQDTIQCFLKKYQNDERPLLLLCEMNNEGVYLFNFRDVYLELTQIHYKYKFIIKESDLCQDISVEGDGKRIFLNYPENLDFTQKENYEIEYFLTGAKYFNNITFIKDSKNLKCSTKNYTKICKVNKSHFYGHQTGCYYTFYSINNKTSQISYDSRPIKIIIEPNIYIKINLEDNIDTKIIGREQVDPITKNKKFSTVSFLTNFDDTESNLFNISDIEKTYFEMQFRNQDDTSTYAADCRLWKPLNDKIRVFVV